MVIPIVTTEGNPPVSHRSDALPAAQRPPARSSDRWITAETEVKERHFRGLLQMHAHMCQGILSRRRTAPYLYIDCHAGPGLLERDGRVFDGSPLIARDTLTRILGGYEGLHFERDAAVAARLAEALWVPTSLLDIPDADTLPIHVEACEDGVPAWLARNGRQPDRYGLVFSDPIGTEIPVRMLAQVAQTLPRVDILTYVGATAYKRRGGARRARGVDSPRLAEHIRAVGKKYALIREPLDGDEQQWTFVLFTDWDGFPDWRNEGFYRLDSQRGVEVLRRLNLTRPELERATNTPLPFETFAPPEPGDATYRTYAEYLRHPRFLAVRRVVFARAAGLCERCGWREPTEPHHLRYPPWGTFDVPDNLIAICHQCHCDIHGKAA